MCVYIIVPPVRVVQGSLISGLVRWALTGPSEGPARLGLIPAGTLNSFPRRVSSGTSGALKHYVPLASAHARMRADNVPMEGRRIAPIHLRISRRALLGVKDATQSESTPAPRKWSINAIKVTQTINLCEREVEINTHLTIAYRYKRTSVMSNC